MALRKDAKIELLKQVPLFAGCSKRELAEIASLADEFNLPGPREVMREGARGREFMIILEGEADVIRKGRLVAGLGPGDFVGEIALVTGEPRTATVRTRGPAHVLFLSTSGFRTLLRDVPSIQAKVLMTLAARIPPEYD
ncbi:MAG TPA: cyclic nucleotide-binding domain-containing protein [Gaiellaceae bacterium]|nr:cyclic nucleotide-binding domain-containing protein [Gaiellaceae bacterium]